MMIKANIMKAKIDGGQLMGMRWISGASPD